MTTKRKPSIKRKRKPRPIPGYTLSHFLLDRAFVAVTEPGRIDEHMEIMLPRVDQRATAHAQGRAKRKGKRKGAR